MFSWWFILIVLNALLGGIGLEVVWAKTKHYREPIPELEAVMPAFRRVDSHRWRKWRFMLGATTLLIPRYLWALIQMSTHIAITSLILCGHDQNKPLPPGCRKSCLRFMYRFTSWTWMLSSNWVWINWKEVPLEDVNYYEEWLGTREEQEAEQRPDSGRDESRIPRRGPGKASTVISNHIGWFEVLALVACPLQTGFCSKDAFKTVPILSTTINGLQSIYIDRGDTAEGKEA